MACCNAILERCDPAGPAGDNTVLIFVNSDGSPPVYKNVDGTDWAGDPNTLTGCAGGGSVSGLTVTENADGTVTVTHDPGDGTTPYTSTFSVGGSSTALNKVDADGVTTAFDPTTECISAAPIQRITDHHGDKITGGTTCAPEDVILHRSLVIGDDHVGGVTGVGGAKHIGVSSTDSDDGPITGITTHHFHAVSTSVTSDATGLRSHVVASRDTVSAGQETAAIASVRSSSTGAFTSTVIGSIDSAASDVSASTLGSNKSASSGRFSTNVGSEDAIASAEKSGNYSSLNVTASAANSVNVGAETSTASGVRSGNYSSNIVTVSGTDSANVASVSVTNDGDVSGMFASNNSSIADISRMSAIVASGGNSQIIAGTSTSSQMVIVGSSDAVNQGVQSGIYNSGVSSQDARIPEIFDAGQSSIIASGGSKIDGQAALNGVNRSAVISGDRHDMQAFNSLMGAGQNGLVTDEGSVSFCGGQATTGGTSTFAHGSSNNGFQSTISVGFRGAAPQPARTLVTLADVILALQEQGLAA